MKRKLGKRASVMLFLVVACLVGIWKTDISSHPQLGIMFWIFAVLFLILGIVLLIIAIAGWCNWDIFGLLANKKEKKRKDRFIIDPEFDNW